VLVVQVKIKQNYVWDRAPNGKMLNRPKEMHAVSTEVLLRFFSSLAVCPVFFLHGVMPRHVCGPCYARFETC
jgi:hypothetical protein